MNIIVKCGVCGKTKKVREHLSAFRCCKVSQGVTDENTVLKGISRSELIKRKQGILRSLAIKKKLVAAPAIEKRDIPENKNHEGATAPDSGKKAKTDIDSEVVNNKEAENGGGNDREDGNRTAENNRKRASGSSEKVRLI